MTETLGPSTELDAVNELLASIGEEPIDDLVILPPAANTALKLLRAQSRDLQEEGYWFNREEGVVLVPDVSGEITIPPSALNVDGTTEDLIVIGTRLYDRASKSFIFTASATCEVTYHRPWTDLTSVVRRYITALALERFIEGFPGADPTSASRQRNLMRAQVAFKRAEIRAGDYNILTNSAVQATLIRS